MAVHNTLSELFTAIANSLRAKTGGSGEIVADDFPAVIDSLSTGGITPSGTKNITTNGTHDVTNYANAQVNIPASGITPSGTKSVTENGEHNVAEYASVKVKVTGLNARIFTSTISADVTSGQATILAANDFLASIRSDPNAFVMVRYLGVTAATAMFSFWFTTNLTLFYGGSNAYNSIVARTTASATAAHNNVNGLTGRNYSGHLNLATDGRLYIDCNATYPLCAGAYQIIAGTLEML